MRGKYDRVPNDSFREGMSDVYYDYYNKKGERLYSTINRPDIAIMYSLIDQLDAYIDHGFDVSSFINEWTAGKDSYIRKRTREYEDDRREKGQKTRGELYYYRRDVIAKLWAAAWENAAQKKEFHAKFGVPDFIKQVQFLLRQIRGKGMVYLHDCDAIKQLADEKTHIPGIDNDNLSLLNSYNKSIQEDLNALGEKRANDIEQSIDYLRKTQLYKYHRGANPVKDFRYIGKPFNSYTFNELFDEIRSYAKKDTIKLVTDHVKKKDSKLYISPLEEDEYPYKYRIEQLGNLVATLTDEQEKRVIARRTECLLKTEEEMYLNDLESAISIKIDNIRDVYEEIKVELKGHERDLQYIDAIRARIKAIDDTYSKLLGNTDYRFSITLKMLNEEKKKCDNALKRYNKKIEKLENLFDRVPSIAEIKELEAKYQGTINVGRERKEFLKRKEEAEQRAIQKEIDAHQANIAYMKEQDLEKRVEEIKSRILSKMHGESLGIRNFVDTDHFEEYYLPEFKARFRGLLEDALHANNIPVKEHYFRLPGDKIEYHIEEPKEDKPGLQMLEQDEKGKYIIHYDDYARLFDRFEKQLLEEKGHCTYNEVFWKVEEYLGSGYTFKLSSKSDFQQIINKHQAEYNERKKSESGIKYR